MKLKKKIQLKKTLKTKQITIKNKDQTWHKNKKTRYIAILERICIENEEREKKRERETKMKIHVLSTSTRVASLANPYWGASNFTKKGDILASVELHVPPKHDDFFHTCQPLCHYSLPQ